MRKAGILLIAALFIPIVTFGQTTPEPAINLLGAHNLSGRGCGSCHTSAAGGQGSGSQETAPWGPNTTPLYGRTIAFGDGGRYVEVLPANISIRNREVDGILVCLSCHDGNLTPPSMMVGQSYEQRVGLLPSVSYGGQSIPTLLGSDNYANDHPVGTAAVIPSGEGLSWVNNTFMVAPGTPYAQFVNNYGWPSLVPGRSSSPWGINASGQPFVLCTTCHNQHVMTVYVSSHQSQIAGDGGGRSYPTFFFVNGPYDPNRNTASAGTNASSPTQFCRQCHFKDSNEANNSNTVSSVLGNY
jgi:hypothetical protein